MQTQLFSPQAAPLQQDKQYERIPNFLKTPPQPLQAACATRVELPAASRIGRKERLLFSMPKRDDDVESPFPFYDID